MELHVRARRLLLASAGITWLLWFLPFGRLIGWPLVMFGTVVHELGHGLTALALPGHSFTKFVIFADGSGLASTTGGGSTHGLVAAGGLLGPAFLGLLGLMAARRQASARVFLSLLAAGLVLATVTVAGNIPALVLMPLTAVALAALAYYDKGAWAQLGLVFLSVQMALAVWADRGYLFMDKATVDGVERRSDTAAVAEALGGEYWMWGIAIGAVSALVLGLGVWMFLRPAGPGLKERRASRKAARLKSKRA